MRDGGRAQTVFIKSRWIVTKRDVAIDFDGKKCGFSPMDEVRAGLGGDAARGLLRKRGRIFILIHHVPASTQFHAAILSCPLFWGTFDVDGTGSPCFCALGYGGVGDFL
jgi:hypothetical protein